MLMSVSIAVVWLGEEITVMKAIGIALVMAGPVLASKRRKQSTPAATPVPAVAFDAASGAATATAEKAAVTPFTPKLVEGYTFGIMAALLWGVGPVLMRAGVDGNGLGVLGGTVGYLAAAAVLLPTLALPGQAAGAIKLDKNARKLFLIAGFGSWLANMFRFSALALAPVTVVIPLMRSALVFTVILNFIFNRHLETYEPRVLAGMGVGMVGAILVVI
jgi:drug/metabolite transporter (DMT)-like permease